MLLKLIKFDMQVAQMNQIRHAGRSNEQFIQKPLVGLSDYTRKSRVILDEDENEQLKTPKKPVARTLDQRRFSENVTPLTIKHHTENKHGFYI